MMSEERNIKMDIYPMSMKKMRNCVVLSEPLGLAYDMDAVHTFEGHLSLSAIAVKERQKKQKL